MANEMEKQNSKGEVKYEVNGQEVELNMSVVAQFITKGNGSLTKTEAFNFMQLCKNAKLNPFLNEAYLVKFGDKPAQMITSKEAFMKRANRQPAYEGMEDGIVVQSENGVQNKQGGIVYPGEKIIGGWARVYRADRKVPTYVEVSMGEFSKGQSTWKQMPAHMIRKVAQVNALREAFPEELGAMYTEEEPQYDEKGRADIAPEKSEKTNELLAEFKQKEASDDVSEKERPNTPEEEPEAVDVEFEEVEEESIPESAEESLNSIPEGEVTENEEQLGLFEGRTITPHGE